MKTAIARLGSKSWIAVVGAGLLLVACGGEQKHVASAPSAVEPPAPPPAQAAAPSTPTASNVSIAQDILRACHLSDADAYFAFDAARVTQTDRTPLDAIAKCFHDGPLSGHKMKLVGRADPRGESDYNVTLGQARADAVAAYLDARGLSNAQTLTTSRGAMDATGTNEPGWAKDRRVDVLLAD
jgi:peptidoglycan-associated lipoprotein